uniref:Uncharacterized protein n=1 Tax=Arundo donax TaxID=35708 RepID=A0A0A9BV05_ARUDO
MKRQVFCNFLSLSDWLLNRDYVFVFPSNFLMAKDL